MITSSSGTESFEVTVLANFRGLNTAPNVDVKRRLGKRWAL